MTKKEFMVTLDSDKSSRPLVEEYLVRPSANYQAEDPEITLIKDELDAREVLPFERRRRDPLIPWTLIDSGPLVLNADGKTTSLPDDPQLELPLALQQPYSPTEADKAWGKRNDDADLPTCYGHAKVRLQIEAVKKKKEYAWGR